jgi:hypothetical protein
MAKRFHLTMTEDSFAFSRDAEAIAAEARRDGIYVVRTNAPAEQLSRVERAFRLLLSLPQANFSRTVRERTLWLVCIL